MMAPERRSRPRPTTSVLHHLAVVLTLPAQAKATTGVAARRSRQRLALAQRLLDPLPEGLKASPDGERFWRIVRWGGAGMVLAWLLQR